MTTEYLCEYCGRTFSKENDEPPYSIHGNTNNRNLDVVCEECYRQFTTCVGCSETININNAYRAIQGNEFTTPAYICAYCRRYTSVHRCCDCGRYLSQTTDHSIVCSETVCRGCIERDYHECAMCGEYAYNRSYRVNGDNITDLCPSCIRRHYHECNHCGDYFTSDRMGMVDGNGYCLNCIEHNTTTCDNCGESTFNTCSTVDGDYVCENCASNYYYYCDDCSEYARIGGTHRHAHMRNYSYKPQAIFHGKEDDGLFYGIEVEAESTEGENCDETASELTELFSDNECLFYVKSDGSLNNGLEVVTHPHTITKLCKAQWFVDVMKYLSDHGYKSHDTSTCGLHVHMSKAAFIDGLHQTRFAWFIYESGFTVPIARRSFGSYCRKVNKTLSDNTPDNFSQTRYEAVNFENRNTVEVRIFKGTLKTNTIYITLQYLDAVFHYTETVRLPVLASITRDDAFLKFIKHKPKYEKLYFHLTHLTNVNQ